MNKFFGYFVTSAAFFWANAMFACGSDVSSASGVDAANNADASGQLSDVDCAAFAHNAAMASATCGAPLPNAAETTLSTFCKKGAKSASMCGGNPAAGLECFKSPDTTDFQCVGGNIYPSCNGDIAAGLGMYCLVALGNPQCASGIRCDFDADCSGNLKCNSATHQCFATSAYCIGLPCTFDLDCPGAEKCNGAEHVCVAR